MCRGNHGGAEPESHRVNRTEMRHILALATHQVLRARIRAAIGTEQRLSMLEDASALWRAVQTRPVSLVIVEANAVTLADTPAMVASLRTAFPAVAVAGYCRLERGVAGAILDLARAGVHDVVIAGIDDERFTLATVVERALRRSTADDVLAHLAPLRLPKAVVRAMRLFLASAGRPIAIARAASLLGVHRRTLASWSTIAGLPTPRQTATGSRLLVAAREG